MSARRGVPGLGSRPGLRPDLWKPGFEQEAGPGAGFRAARGAGSAISVKSLSQRGLKNAANFTPANELLLRL